MSVDSVGGFGVRAIASGVVLLAIAVSIFTRDSSISAQELSSFASGQDVVVTTSNLNFRTSASIEAEILDKLCDGTWATVVSGPVSVDGYDWYELDIDGVTGWSVADYLDDATETTTLMPVGTLITVTTDGLNLRDVASLDGAVLGSLSYGSNATVISGPVSESDLSWYQVRVGSLTGWVARTFIAFAPGSGTDLTAGETATVNTGSLTLRESAGVDSAEVSSLTGGETVIIVGGPEDLDGYAWFNVETDSGTGWVAGDYLVGD